MRDGAGHGQKDSAVHLGQKKLKPADERLVRDLAQRDRAVRAHEAAHQSAAGSLGGAATFTFQTGPDGKSYAVGGEVPVDMSSGRTPAETLARAQQVRTAALAPADPSPQDVAVAAQASQIEAIARQQMVQAATQALQGKGSAHEQKVAATLSALASRPVAAGTPSAQVQQLARLAAAAYRI